MQPPSDIGPFELLHSLGAGGMADVWKARHRASGLVVALKAQRTDVNFEEELWVREVQSMALLNHPNVVAVFDHGFVDDAESGRSGPYMVMEYVEGPTLGQLADSNKVGWFELKQALLSTLHALAHAHARGLVHRDIKPANVLTTLVDEQRVYKLADFGIAHARRQGDSSSTAGTPHYMAPEQFMSRWREFGPATDIYSLGCLAFELSSGTFPFEGENALALAMQHMMDPPANWEAKIPTPIGFKAWMMRCLEKAPNARFPTAPAAALALAQLGDPTAGRIASHSKEMVTFAPDTSPTLVMSSIGMTVGPTEKLVFEELEEITFGAESPNFGPVPRIPRRWETELSQSAVIARSSTQLFGLRHIPLIGRVEEQNTIWDAWVKTDASKRPHACVLHGNSGMGKSAIAEWFVTRVRELGVANVLEIRGQKEHQGSVGSALRELLVCTGLEGEGLAAQIDLVMAGCDLDPTTRNGLLAALKPSAEPIDIGVAHATLTGLAERDRLVVWVDDVQWTTDALELVETLIQSTIRSPIFFLITAQTEAVALDPGLVARLDALAGLDDAQAIWVEALTTSESESLVKTLLDLAPDTVQQLVDRAEGNALFMTQLLHECILGELLQPSSDGLRLRSDATVGLPLDLHSVWVKRFQSVTRAFTQNEIIALEVAAVLGKEVLDIEWASVKRIAQTPGQDRLLPTLVANGLARRLNNGWMFAHGLLRESIIQDLTQSKRLAAVSERAAETLIELHPGLTSRSAQIGNLLADAGRNDEAIEHLIYGAELAAEAVRHGSAKELYQRAKRIVAPQDSRMHLWIDVQIAASLASLTRNRQYVNQMLESAQVARTSGWNDVAADALIALANFTVLEGRTRGVDTFALEALDLYRMEGSHDGLARAHMVLGDYYAFAGEWKVGADHYRASIEDAAMAGLDWVLAWGHWGLGHIYYQRLDMTRALRHLERAYDTFLEVGRIRSAISVLGSLGDVYRYHGDPDAARKILLQAEDYFRQTGARKAGVQMNLAVLEILRDQPETAMIHLEAAEELLKTHPRINFTAYVQIIRAIIAAHDNDFGEWDRNLSLFVETSKEAGMLEVDQATLAAKAAEIMHPIDVTRAQNAANVSVSIWRQLDLEDMARQCAARFDVQIVES